MNPWLHIWIAALLISPLFSFAQSFDSPIVRNFSPKDYRAGAVNYDIIQDENGLIYVGNIGCVLEYDGTSWRKIPIPENILVRSLRKDASGRIYIGGIGEFGYLSPGSGGSWEYIPVSNDPKFGMPEIKNTILVHITAGGVYFLDYINHILFRFKNEKLERKQLPEDTGLLVQSGDRLFIRSKNKGMLELKGLEINPLPGGEFLKEKAYGLFSGDGNDGFFLIGESGSMVRYKPDLPAGNQFVTMTLPVEVRETLKESTAHRMLRLSNGNLAIATTRDGVFIIDTLGEFVSHYGQETGLQDDFVLDIAEDREKNLWLSLSRGISRVEAGKPIQRWGEEAGMEGIVYSVSGYMDAIYATTTLGVFQLKDGKVNRMEGAATESWQTMTYFPPGEEKPVLLFTTPTGLTAYVEGKGILKEKGPMVSGILISHKDPGLIFGISKGGIYLIRFTKGKWSYEIAKAETSGLNLNGSMAEDSMGNLWLSERWGDGGLSCLVRQTDPDGKMVFTLKEYDRSTGPPFVNCLSRVNGDVTFGTINGLYHYNPDTDGFEPETGPMAFLSKQQLNILSLSQDKAGNLWFERESGDARWVEVAWKEEDGSFRRDSTSLMRIRNQEFWSEIYPDPNGGAWFGGVEGLFYYNPALTYSPPKPLPPLIRKITVGKDSLIFGGVQTGTGDFPIRSGVENEISRIWEPENRTRLPFRENQLKIWFAAPYYMDETATLYQYRLRGSRQDYWSEWTSETRRDLANLPPGPYVFELRATDLCGQVSPVTAFAFSITPPWYRSTGAFLSYFLFAFLFIGGAIRINTRRLQKQNENLELIVRERTTELLLQAKEIDNKNRTLEKQTHEIRMQSSQLEEKNRDLNELLDKLKSAQSQLVQSEKMASLGQLTAGVAHEINNPINFVSGNTKPLKRDIQDLVGLIKKYDAYLLEKGLKKDHPVFDTFKEEVDFEGLVDEIHSLLDGMEEGANRTAAIVRGLRNFSRSSESDRKIADINEGIESTLMILRNQLKTRGITVETDLQPLPPIMCFPGKLNQVFMNILTNAIQAIDPPPGLIQLKSWEEDARIHISIKDSGKGMEESVIQHIFEPFFTTKEVGEGTGLGLSISFRIIKDHGGSIRVESQAGAGTTFTISLPVEA
jgi:signal transduction histidine kinase